MLLNLSYLRTEGLVIARLAVRLGFVIINAIAVQCLLALRAFKTCLMEGLADALNFLDMVDSFMAPGKGHKRR